MSRCPRIGQISWRYQKTKLTLQGSYRNSLSFKHQTDKEIVTAGGFKDELEVRSSRGTTELLCLNATNEEADTRLAFHAMNFTSDVVIVSPRDTDVLVILISHFHRMHAMNYG